MGDVKRPWRRFQPSGSPEELTFDDRGLYDTVRETAVAHPHAVAFDYFGKAATYRQLLSLIDETADGLVALGVKPGDRITVCLPNCPQAVAAFYAIDKVGAVSSMIHPLSAVEEIRTYLAISSSRWALTLDAFWPRFEPALAGSRVEKTVYCRIQEHMPFPIRAGFAVTKGRKIKRVPNDSRALSWEDFLHNGRGLGVEPVDRDPRGLAVLLYSGGTTGMPKGIMLSSWNFNALAQSLVYQLSGGIGSGDKVLSILPLFHGFGLGVTAHAFFAHGGTSILVPRFSADEVIKVLLKKKPQIIAGVPTLFEALSIHPEIAKVDFSGLRGCFGGGDKVPETVKKRFDTVLAAGGGTVELLEGYGLTETVTACTITPVGEFRKESIGIPMTGIDAKIVSPDTVEELPHGEEGELCITGPTNMLGYLDRPEETADTIKRHPDGREWVHTGDLCHMDEDGFIYFKMRLKRMVKVSGIAVYPPQVEEALRSHPAIRDACVVGKPDPYKMSTLKAYVVLDHGFPVSDETEEEILSFCVDKLNRWSIPESIAFRDELPLTRVGKVAFTELEREAREGAAST